MDTVQLLNKDRARIRDHWVKDEASLVRELIAQGQPDPKDIAAIAETARDLVEAVRARTHPTMMESFLAEYSLSTEEGIGLMCLAEALLRVPDADTIDDLIRDKIEPGDWGTHFGRSSSSLVNAATWGLMLTGSVLDRGGDGPVAALRGAVRRLGEPVIRLAVGQAMRILGNQFVLAQSIEEGIATAAGDDPGLTHSFDMLGEAARTEADAARYFDAYAHAIRVIAGRARDDIRSSPGISIKLSALHPRYEWMQRPRVLTELVPRVTELACMAADANIGLNIDAEEANRLDLSLDVIGEVLASTDLNRGERRVWAGFGVVVQAYGRRALPLIDYLTGLSEHYDRYLMVRLVKGAYWDTEIKLAQVLGVPGFPVFTRKAHTDVSFLACARRLQARSERLYAQYATHNAHTVAAILHMDPATDRFEFQRLHGMGEALHDAVRRDHGTACRIYAPVGAHEDLLAYLVRRLLENGANSSFVNQIVDLSVSAETIAANPFARAQADGGPVPHPGIRAPIDLFRPHRGNSMGLDVNEPASIAPLLAEREAFRTHTWSAAPILVDSVQSTVRPEVVLLNPAKPDDVVGRVTPAASEDVEAALAAAARAAPAISETSVAARAEALRRAADLYEAHLAEFAALLAREAGKTLADAIGEVREAVDFLRFYAAEAERLADNDRLAGRGVMVCISPWNFPLAIFTGQIAACLAAGNAVIAKPAEQTPLVAARATALLHVAGISKSALQLLPGDGPGVGAPLTSDPRIAGVCFTGSTEVAQLINRALAENAGPAATLVAETGGINAMIVDSTALAEQAVRDIIVSAFQSAGQRCSALRVLYVQEDVADKVLEMLEGAAALLRVGDPWALETDVGPLIDADAHADVAGYCADARREGRVLFAGSGPADGTFVSPTIVRTADIGTVAREVFGPVLHVATYRADDLDRVIEDINDRGFGLTFGLHTRIDDRVDHVISRVNVGNIYVNRNQIGAVVGSQPFGGEGLSGTGPKAGGPGTVARLTAPEPTPSARNSVAKTAVAAPASTAPDLQAAAHDALSKHVPGLPDQRVADLRDLFGHAGMPRLDVAVWVAAEEAARLVAERRTMPGPTGESNRLGYHPRGLILCLGDGEVDALAAACVSLAAGNAVVVLGPYRAKLADAFAASTLAGVVVPVSDASQAGLLAAISRLETLATVAVAPSFDGRGALYRVLAGRDGPLVPLVTELLDPQRYLLERHVCIDTTASGGNAALLTASAQA